MRYGMLSIDLIAFLVWSDWERKESGVEFDKPKDGRWNGSKNRIRTSSVVYIYIYIYLSARYRSCCLLYIDTGGRGYVDGNESYEHRDVAKTMSASVILVAHHVSAGMQ